MTSADSRPVLKVVRGDATPEEVAALLVVLTAARRTSRPAASAPTSTWATRPPALQAPLRHGPNAWRASGLPR